MPCRKRLQRRCAGHHWQTGALPGNHATLNIDSGVEAKAHEEPLRFKRAPARAANHGHGLIPETCDLLQSALKLTEGNQDAARRVAQSMLVRFTHIK